MAQTHRKPLLFVDIDGVLSLFGWPLDVRPSGRWLQVDGIAHLLSEDGARLLLELVPAWFDPVWCTGWKDRANDHLPHMLGLGPWPYLVFGESPGHWKLAEVQRHAGGRPLAWIDDDLNDHVRAWAAARAAPTLIVETDPATGLTAEAAERLRTWAQALDQPSATP